MSIPFATLGIDLGATLCKTAFRAGPDADVSFESFASSDLDAIRAYTDEQKADRLVATGGGAAGLRGLLGEDRVEVVAEFDAWARGARILAETDGFELPERYLLVSLGTGTSVLAIEAGTHRRAGGSALGGGAILGLGQLLTGSCSFHEIARQAARGDRRKVDLLVGDIYPADTPLHPDLNAASFAKLESRDRADLAHALMGLVGENVGLICGHLLQVTRADTVLLCGSTLDSNPSLADILRGVILAFGGRAHFLPRGAYCGAVGAAALSR